MVLGGGTALPPFVGLKGVWDFDRTDLTTAAGDPIGTTSFHGRIEAGAILQTAGGMMVRASDAYDGLGDPNGSRDAQQWRRAFGNGSNWYAP